MATVGRRYGRNELLGSARTEHTSAHLVSVRLNESVGDSVEENKKIAYLIDLQVIRTAGTRQRMTS